VFLCGTGAQVSPVSSVDHRPVGDGSRRADLERQISKTYFDAVRGRLPAFRHWVTPCTRVSEAAARDSSALRPAVRGRRRQRRQGRSARTGSWRSSRVSSPGSDPVHDSAGHPLAGGAGRLRAVLRLLLDVPRDRPVGQRRDLVPPDPRVWPSTGASGLLAVGSAEAPRRAGGSDRAVAFGSPSWRPPATSWRPSAAGASCAD
jgi:hypothetical protein